MLKLLDLLKNAASTSVNLAASSDPVTSLQECMASCGIPTSKVATPSRAAVIGPMVLPQAVSLRDTKLCTGTSTSAQS